MNDGLSTTPVKTLGAVGSLGSVGSKGSRHLVHFVFNISICPGVGRQSGLC